MLGWLFSIIPDSIFIFVYYVLLSTGVALYVASKLTAWIPMMSQYKLPAELAGIAALVIGTYIMGGYSVQSAWQARVTELEAKVKIAEAKSAVVNKGIQEKIVYKTQIVKEVQVKIEERIKEVAGKVNEQCVVDPAAIQILNDAAAPITGAVK